MSWGKRTPTERWWLCGAGRETTSWCSSTQRALRLYEERSIEVSGCPRPERSRLVHGETRG